MINVLGVPLDLLAKPEGLGILAIVSIVGLVLFVKNELKNQNIACEKRSQEERETYRLESQRQKDEHTKEITALRLELKECNQLIMALTKELYELKGQKNGTNG